MASEDTTGAAVAKDPQTTLEEFWEGLVTKKTGKVTNIFPPSLYSNLLPPQKPKDPAKGINAAESYEAAAEECRARVKRIVRECHRTNQKFTDPEFDIEDDLGHGDCLKGLMDGVSGSDSPTPGDSTVDGDSLKAALGTLAGAGIFGDSAVAVDLSALGRALNASDSSDSSRGPPAVHRIDYIFDKPQFVIDGFSSSDVRQGANGDCWWIAAVATLCSAEHLIERVCVARNEDCGVYGFVFHRDGEWFSTVVDDNLYMKQADFDQYMDIYDPTGEKERKFKKNHQTGSEALYFAHCADPNETWLPLLEKAYAKAHGDFDAISGGSSGEAVEDMTGGVTTNIFTNKILSKERLWKELENENGDLIFAASSPSIGTDSEARRGLALGHAYSILKAVEEEDEDGNKVRLVLIRNPWGERSYSGMGEWNGPWSDGSKEWTPYWMNKLNHKFGDDGEFWMSYEDLRKRFSMLDRTRLFDDDWTVVQQWTALDIGWVTGYLTTKFLVEITQGGPTVFVLSQLDDRYFKGLEGQYTFELHFLLQEENAPAGEHLVRARSTWFGARSVNAEVDLEPGRYEVLPKIAAIRDTSKYEVQDVVKALAEVKSQKLRQIGMNYDIANSKAIPTEEQLEAKKKVEEEKAAKEKAEEDKKAKEAADRLEFEAWKARKAAKEKKSKKAEKEAPKKGKKSNKPEEADPEESNRKTDEEGSDEEDPEEANEEEEKEEDEGDHDEADEETESENESEEKPTKGAPKGQQKQLKVGKGSGHKGRTLPSALPFRPAAAHREAPESAMSVDEAELEAEPEEQEGEADAEADAEAAEKPAAGLPEPNPNPWNAVCVVGLKVYARDKDVSIKLIKPKDLDEAALLDVDGATAAGATL